MFLFMLRTWTKISTPQILCFVCKNFFPAMTKIVGNLGPRSRSVDVISGCLKVGMSDINRTFCSKRSYASWINTHKAYHEDTLIPQRAVGSTLVYFKFLL